MLEILQTTKSKTKSLLEDYNNKLIKLHKLLYDKLYLENIQSTNSKEDLEFYIKPKDKYQALHDNFIKYGSKTATNFLIIDIDNIKTNILEYEKEVIYKLGIKPNWITKTKNGFHIGFVLEKTVFLNDINQKEKLQETKRNFTTILNGDIAGSYRLIGFWRNPLTHKSIIRTELYNLEELHKASFREIKKTFSLFDSESEIKQKTEIIKKSKEEVIKINIDKIDKKGFKEGNRNNYLFTKTISLLYQGKINNNQVYETLVKINNKELQEQELRRIEKSIIKYKIVPNTAQNNKDYKTRGEYSNLLWENKIHNYKNRDKIEFSRQKIGQIITTAKVIKSTISKLVEGYKVTYRNNEVFTNKNIIKNSKVSKSTIKRYRNVRKLENEIKSKAFMLYMREIVSIEELKKKKSVKAIEPPIKDLVNLALSELYFEYKKTNEVFAFKIDDNLRLIFYKIAKENDLEAA